MQQKSDEKLSRVTDVFERTFRQYNTLLVRGDSEPVYLPADSQSTYHRIVFAHGFLSSALHEIAHWCIAGTARRLQTDYGYWYCPDGRNAQQQQQFEQVEVKPQALEWAFSLACDSTFRVSTDNLDGVEPDRAAFESKVKTQLETYIATGFPARAQSFIHALQIEFNTPLLREYFHLDVKELEGA